MSAFESGAVRASLTTSGRRSNKQEESAMVMDVMAEVAVFPRALVMVRKRSRAGAIGQWEQKGLSRGGHRLREVMHSQPDRQRALGGSPSRLWHAKSSSFCSSFFSFIFWVIPSLHPKLLWKCPGMKLTIIGMAKALTDWNRPGQSHGVVPWLQRVPGDLQLGQMLNLQVWKSPEVWGSQREPGWNF